MSPAVLATLDAATAGLALLRARTPGTPAGDEDEQHEDNTYDLPNGNPIRRGIKRFAARQLKKLLGTLPGIGAPIPGELPTLAGWTAPMADAMTPMIAAYWDEAGKTTRARLGLDPDEWEVHDPHLHQKIREASLSFCAETNATTDDQLAAALDKLRRELNEGLVEQGESIPELTERVRAVFQRLATSRAEMIGRTEAARAVHAASLESAKESGVVTGKKWLVSANSCDRCHDIAATVNAESGVPIDGAFASDASKNPEYSTVRHPPLHPNCRCSMTYVLAPEYRPENTEAGPLGPEPEAGKAPKQPPRRPKKARAKASD